MENGHGETSGKISISGSLKYKLNLLENAVTRIKEDIQFQKKEVSMLKSEKEQMEKVLEQKAIETRKAMEEEVNRCDSDMRNKFQSAKSQNNKLQQEVTQIKQEKTTLQQEVLSLQRKIAELELVIGENK